VRLLSERGCILIAHNRGEIDAALSNGVVLNYLPLLVSKPVGHVSRSIIDRDLKQYPPVIASTGFIRHHKGLPQLIEAMSLVRAAFPGARLLLQCALYPSPDSREEHELCLRTIAATGLGAAVTIDTSFRPIEEVHQLLSAADLVVLPYGPSNEGGSASATTALSSGVPLLVSSSKVFTETKSAAGQLRGTSPSEIADEICRLFQKPDAYGALATKARTYAEENCGATVAVDLLKYIDAAIAGRNCSLTQNRND